MEGNEKGKEKEKEVKRKEKEKKKKEKGEIHEEEQTEKELIKEEKKENKEQDKKDKEKKPKEKSESKQNQPPSRNKILLAPSSRLSSSAILPSENGNFQWSPNHPPPQHHPPAHLAPPSSPVLCGLSSSMCSTTVNFPSPISMTVPSSPSAPPLSPLMGVARRGASGLTPVEDVWEDVFRRADKNDAGSLSWAEFRSFIGEDKEIDDKGARALFSYIDILETNEISVEELNHFFQSGVAPYEGAFKGLGVLHKEMSDVMGYSAQYYPSQNTFDRCKTRFYLREAMEQIHSLASTCQTATRKLNREHEACSKVSPSDLSSPPPSPLEERRGGEEGREGAGEKGERELTAPEMLIAMTKEVSRLGEIVSFLDSSEIKTLLPPTIEEENDDNWEESEFYFAYSYKYKINPLLSTFFQTAMSHYAQYTREEYGCKGVTISTLEPNVYSIYEVWEDEECQRRHFALQHTRDFARAKCDCLAAPEEMESMPLPSSWRWK